MVKIRQTIRFKNKRLGNRFSLMLAWFFDKYIDIHASDLRLTIKVLTWKDIAETSFDSSRYAGIIYPERLTRVKKRHYKLCIQRQDIDDFELILHELWHFQQYSTLKTYDCRDGVVWKKRFYPYDTPYCRCRWEVEAYKMQRKVYLAFLRYERKLKKRRKTQ